MIDGGENVIKDDSSAVLPRLCDCGSSCRALRTVFAMFRSDERFALPDSLHRSTGEGLQMQSVDEIHEIHNWSIKY
jgi:hypothetical protein